MLNPAAYTHHTMRRICANVSVIVLALGLTLPVVEQSVLAADMADGPSLTISQIKITSSHGQFITLHNATGQPLDMSRYQLEYFNNYDLGKATSSKIIALSGTLPPHGYYMVNDSTLLLCYQLVVNSVSLGLSSTAGFIEVLALNQSSPGGPVSRVLQDYIGWSKTATTGAQTLPANTSAWLVRQPVDNAYHPIVTSPGTGSWQTVQPTADNPCALQTTTASPTQVPTGFGLLLPPSEPPATIVNLSAGDSESEPTTPRMPPGNIGLMAPQLTELLANPDGTGNDSTDEFIELHNPNAVSFELSGFALQVGLTTFRKYTFPANTHLPPKSFTAFYAETTGLSLSNTSSEVKLLDPFGNSLVTSGVYAKAKDGQAWALAKGKWYWTTSQTPNAANVIKQPVATKKTTTSKLKSAKKPTGSSKASPKSGSAANDSTGFNEEPSRTPIHTWSLALVAGLALLYGAYEYRADLANRFYQFKRHFSAGRANRPET